MAQKGQLKPPVETPQMAFRRAMRAFGKAEGQIALYMVAGKLTSTTADSPDYASMVKKFESALIGVYENTIDTRNIYDDIQSFYSEFPYIPPPVIDPVFRSSGRRSKK